MSGRDWFIVGARLIGVWSAYTTVTYITSYFDVRLGYGQPVMPGSLPGGYLIHGTGHLLVALYLLLKTHHLASLCYDRDDHPRAEKASAAFTAERDLT